MPRGFTGFWRCQLGACKCWPSYQKAIAFEHGTLYTALNLRRYIHGLPVVSIVVPFFGKPKSLFWGPNHKTGQPKKGTTMETIGSGHDVSLSGRSPEKGLPG